MTPRIEAQLALVADDDPVTRRVLAMLLERQGVDVRLAEDGEAALRHARADHPDIIFLDARMPDPDGYEVCRILRDEGARPEPFIFMLTAAGQDSDRQKAAAVGVDEFLTKPFSPSKLLARLQQSSREPRA
jgi:CheY-like chemotaxis protein